MIRDYSQIGPMRHLEGSLTGNLDQSQQIYNGTYKKLAEDLHTAVDNIIKQNPKLLLQRVTILATVGFGSSETPKEDQEITSIALSPAQRYYPEDLEGKIKIYSKPHHTLYYLPQIQFPRSQLAKLINDLGRSCSELEIEKMRASPSFGLYHQIFMLRAALHEYIILKFGNRSVAYDFSIDEVASKPELIEDEKSSLFKLNTALVKFDLTESGECIGIGYDRLMLMKSVLQYLNFKSEIETLILGLG